MIDRRRVLAAVASAGLAPVAAPVVRAIPLPLPPSPPPPLLASSALAALLA
jgi:hypothetical protein